MRIRTEGDFEHREEVLAAAADAWGCNRTRAVLKSCELAARLQDDRLEQLLEHEDMTAKLVEELDRVLGPDVSIERRVRSIVEFQ